MGIAIPLEIASINDSNADTVQLTTKEVDESQNVIEAVEFSGAADFSYLLNNLDDNTVDNGDVEEGRINDAETLMCRTNQLGGPMMLCAAANSPVLVASGWWKELTDKVTEKTTIQGNESTPKANLEIGFQYREDERGDKRFTITPRLNGKFMNYHTQYCSLDMVSC